MTTLEISALGPLLFRDARPFSGSADETRASSFAFPLPSTISGMVRGTIARQALWDLTDPPVLDELSKIHVLRYWFEFDGEPVFAAPGNCVVVGSDPAQPQALRLAPFVDLPDGWGCDMPDGLSPVHVVNEPAEGAEDAQSKPLRGYELRSVADSLTWLAGRDASPVKVAAPLIDERVQIQRDPQTSTAAQGKLFTVAYRDWDRLEDGRLKHWRLMVETEGGPDVPAGTMRAAHFGGEHGQVGVTWAEESGFPEPSEGLRDAVLGTQRVVMQLASPAIFDHGWKASWMDDPKTLDRALDGRLVAACVNRPEAVSGWSLDPRSYGPKATRLAAPAGSVYFFELKNRPDSEALDRLWSRAVSDKDHDNNDGYGLALWGVWNR